MSAIFHCFRASLRLRVLLFALLFAHTASAHEARVDAARFFDRGIYDAEEIAFHSDTGVRTVRSPRLLHETTEIPAKLGYRFGLKYILRGSPTGSLATIDMVTRYPPQGLAREPNKPLQISRYSKQILIGVFNYRDFYFTEREELVPGIWIFEFWHAGRKIGEQHFCVFTPEAAHRSVSSCEDLIG